MSTLKVNNLQVGQDGTAANNYTLYQPASPDGTVRLGYGVAGSVTDILTLKNSRLGIGTNDPQGQLTVVLNNNGLEFNPGSGQAIVSYNRSTSAYKPVGMQGSTVGLYIGGYGEALHITSAGNVGIGDTNPGDRLTVYKANVGNPTGITIRNTNAGSTYSHARLRLESQNAAAYAEIWADVANSALRLGYNSSSTVNIDNAGRLFVGGNGTVASSSERLTVRGMSMFKLDSTTTAPVYIQNANFTASTYQPYLTMQDGSGNRGAIGVENNTSALWMSGQTGIIFRGGTSAPGNAEWMRITSTGNVGIGEISPADRLVVQKTNATGDVAVRIKNDTLTDGTAANPTTASLYLNTSTGDFNTFYIQARRNDNDTHFGYADPRSNNHTPNMIISNDGLVTTPNRPRFIAKLSANTTYNPSSFGNYVDFDSEEYDIGGNFTTSGANQGLFTAPVAGLYHFNASAYCVGQALTQSWFVVNGVRASYTDWVLSSTADFAQNSQAIYLNAGDKVGFHPHKGGTSSFTVNTNAHHTYFSGYLIG